MRNVRTWLHVCALIIMSLSLISCGKRQGTESNQYITNGRLISVTSGYDPVVMIRIPGSNGLCTGTFISRRAVLTASHCAQASGTYSISTSFGNFTSSTKVTYGSGSVNDVNDLALIIFNSDVANDSQVYGVGSNVRTGENLRLVGYGCNDLTTRQGSGIKRTGTNVVGSLSSYITFYTPSSGGSAAGIIGFEDRAGSCFGDSGGPALQSANGKLVVIGVTHAGGTSGGEIISQYIDLSRSDNRQFLSTVNSNYGLGIAGL
jgi:secreted trypsin-like serine protease